MMGLAKEVSLPIGPNLSSFRNNMGSGCCSLVTLSSSISFQIHLVQTSFKHHRVSTMMIGIKKYLGLCETEGKLGDRFFRFLDMCSSRLMNIMTMPTLRKSLFACTWKSI